MKIQESYNGQTGQDVLVFNNGYPKSVFVGQQGLRYDRNPDMLNNC